MKKLKWEFLASWDLPSDIQVIDEALRVCICALRPPLQLGSLSTLCKGAVRAALKLKSVFIQ
jgi:hypothetical protein